MHGIAVFSDRHEERERERNTLTQFSEVRKALRNPKIFSFSLGLLLLAVFTYFAFALPSITYVSPTLSDNSTTGSNWVFVNVTSSENLTQSLLEWGNSTGFTNVSMSNLSASMQNWYKNMTGLADGTYNYTVFAQNTTGGWNQTQRRWVTVDTTLPQISFISPTPANDTNQTWGFRTINVSITETNPAKLILNWNGTNTTYNYSGTFWNITKNGDQLYFSTNNPAGLRDGTYTYYVWLNDTAGNSNQTETRTITINGTDGIQAAIDALPANGGTVQLDSRTYSINNTIYMDKPNTTLNGTQSSILMLQPHDNPSSGANDVVYIKMSDCSNCLVEGFKIRTNFTWSASGTSAIRVWNSSNSIIRNMDIDAYTMYAIRFNQEGGGGWWNTTNITLMNNIVQNSSVILVDVYDSTIYNNSITRGYRTFGLDLNSVVKRTHVYNNTVKDAGNGNIKTYISNDYNIIENNTLINGEYGLEIYLGPSNSVFKNNRLYGASKAGIYIIPQYAVYNFTVINNIIYNNKWGILGEYISGAGSYANVTIKNNVIFNNTQHGILLNYSAITLNMSNNIIANNSVYGIYFVNGTLNESYNDVWGNVNGSYNGTSAGTGDISLDPLFANVSAYDFHLKSQYGRWNGTSWVTDAQTSPAIDAGDPTADYSLEPSPNGGRINMGAYGGTNEASKTYSASSSNCTKYVATYGNNASDGLTLTTAWKNPAYAAQQAQAGDTICIVNGTYFEPNGMEFTPGNSGNATHPIRITAYNGTPIVSGNWINGKYGFSADDTSNNYGAKYIQIDGLTISGFHRAVDIKRAQNITVKNMILYNSSENMIQVYSANNITIENNILLDYQGYNSIEVGGARSGESGYNSSSEIFIINNIIRNNANHGGVQFDQNTFNVTISGNTFVNNTYSGGIFTLLSAAADTAPRSFTIKNNNLTDIGIGLQLIEASDGVVENMTIMRPINYGLFVWGNYFTGDGRTSRNIIYRNITIDNPSASAYNSIIGGQDILFERINLINSTYVYDWRLTDTTGNITFRDEIEPEYTILLENNASVNVEYTDGSVFKYTLNSGTPDSTVYAWYPDKSNFSQIRTALGTNYITITKYNMTAKPSSGYATITTDGQNLTSIQTDLSSMSSPKIWNMTIFSNDSTTTATFNISTGLNSKSFNIYRNNTLYITVTTNSTGGLNYKYAGGFSTYEFSFQESSGLITTLNTPQNSYLTNNQTITFNCSSTSANPLVNITLFGNWSGWSAKNTTNITGTSNSSQWLNTLTDGSYIWNCLAYDTTGNSSFSSQNYTLTIDTLKPIIQIVSPQNTTYASSVWFNITLSEAGSWAGYSLNGAANVSLTNTTGKWWAQNTSMANGQHTVKFYANDSADNINSTSVTFTVDTTAPAVSLISPSGAYNTSSTSITFSFNATDNLNASMACSLYTNGTSIATNASTINATATTFANTGVSASLNQNWTVICSDGVNTNAPANRTFNVDNVIPTSNSPADASYSQNSSAVIGWILYDNYAGGYYRAYRNGTVQNQSTWTNNTNLNVWVNTSTLGTWNYTITYNDSLGNNGSSDTVIINVTGDLTAPAYSLNSTNSNNAGMPIKHSLYWVDDVQLSGYIFSFDNGNGTFSNDSWVAFTGTGNWSNVTKTVNSTVGATIRWKFYANDTSNNWNASLVYAYNTTACAESWSYSAWSACSGGTQARTATDANSCGTYVNQSALSQSCSSGTSSSSGGGGGGSTATNTITVMPNDPLTKIVVNLKSSLDSPSLIVANVETAPVSPQEPVYQYVNITKSKFNNTQIENATIDFKVNKSWILENNFTAVYLARYENGWAKLRTDLVNSTSTTNHYRAYTDAFSYFAIVGEKAQTAPVVEPRKEPVKEVPKPSEQAKEPQKPITEPKKPYLTYAVAVIVLIIAGYAVKKGLVKINSNKMTPSEMPENNQNASDIKREGILMAMSHDTSCQALGSPVSQNPQKLQVELERNETISSPYPRNNWKPLKEEMPANAPCQNEKDVKAEQDEFDSEDAKLDDIQKRLEEIKRKLRE